jgi:exodeoxyribonuclease VIII
MTHHPYANIEKEHEMLDLMVDLETLGRRPGCIVLSIGAVYFSAEGLGEQYYTVISAKDQKDWGLHEDPDTLEWWEKQSPEARVVLEQARGPDAKPLANSLLLFDDWLNATTEGNANKVRPWGNGADFDNAILQALYHIKGGAAPWPFWNNRCFRTLKNIGAEFGIKAQKRQGTYHNALDDARHQALHAVAIFQRLAGFLTQPDAAPPEAASQDVVSQTLAGNPRVQNLINRALDESSG